jgi:predicted signal transduction protein with EAL and GGDEF domain
MRRDFFLEVAGRSLESARAHWAKRVFTGRGRPPAMLAEEEVEQTIKQNTGAVTYVPDEQLPENGKVLLMGHLVKASQALAASDLETRAPETGSNELSYLAHNFNRMADAVAERTVALQENKSKLRAMLNNPALLIGLLDTSGNILITDKNGLLTHYVMVFSDISQIKQSQEQLDYLAHHDALTDLPNRLLLNECLEQAIRHAERNNTQIAIIFFDLDTFEHINDSLGHPVGDKLLQEVAAKLKQTIRGDDTVAIIGGTGVSLWQAGRS